MPTLLGRRTFLSSVAAALASTREMLAQQAPRTNLKLGLDSYTIRNLGWKADRIIEYCAEQKVDNVQLSVPGDFESTAPAVFERAKRIAADKGVTLEGAMGSICTLNPSWGNRKGTPVEYLQTSLTYTSQMGAKILRCYIGGPGYRVGNRRPTGDQFRREIDQTVDTLKAVRTQAHDLGIKIAVENHGDIQAREMIELVERAGKDWVGVNLDSGNPYWVIEDPLHTLELLGPYTLTTHLRDGVLFPHERGVAFQWTRIGDGAIDWKKFIAKFVELCPNAPFQMEIITGRPPTVLPVYDDEFWSSFTYTRASDFARFLRLAKNGKPFWSTMIIAEDGQGNAAYRAAWVEQQRVDFEKSCSYARSLGVGRV